MFFKRITDLLISAIALVCFAPGFLALGLAICLDSKGSAIFRQKRIGRKGELFEIYKFRTMYIGTPDLPTDQMQKMQSRVTRVGSFLRRTSLDELPQLLNVFLGQMSIVGPRPALYNQTELTAKRMRCGVLNFPPGITGWAQVNGRDELPDDVKVAADQWYCDNWSYWLDWRIIFQTFQAVASKRGAF
jgi:O-antigen biosynthesis protein WbqP